MDEAADKAYEEFNSISPTLDQKTLVTIQEWWKKWTSQAGYKRLGRILLGKER
jgi:hypothetical protein